MSIDDEDTGLQKCELCVYWRAEKHSNECAMVVGHASSSSACYVCWRQLANKRQREAQIRHVPAYTKRRNRCMSGITTYARVNPYQPRSHL